MYLNANSRKWADLPRDFPPPPTSVSYHYRKWAEDGTWRRVSDAIRERVREAAGRDEHPSAGALDSQTAKAASTAGTPPATWRTWKRRPRSTPPSSGGWTPSRRGRTGGHLQMNVIRTCSPSEFASRWPDCLRPVTFLEPPPAIPEGCWRLLTEFGLPRELTIYCYNDIAMRFSGSAEPLAVIWARDLNRGYKMGDMPSEWARFWHLADAEYLQGGGWVCVEEVTGRLVVIDVNLRDPICLLNSSVRNFYTTLAYFLEWSERTGGNPAETVGRRDSLRRQDCIPPEELEPFWMSVIDATLDGDPITLAVTLGPMSPPSPPVTPA